HRVALNDTQWIGVGAAARRSPFAPLPYSMALVHIAIAQIKPRKGDYRGNLGRLKGLFVQLDQLDPRPMVLSLPESALTGYFLEGGVRDNAVTAGTLARDLDVAYREAVTSVRPLDVTLGFYEVWNNKLYNSAMYVTLGSGGAGARPG